MLLESMVVLRYCSIFVCCWPIYMHEISELCSMQGELNCIAYWLSFARVGLCFVLSCCVRLVLYCNSYVLLCTLMFELPTRWQVSMLLTRVRCFSSDTGGDL